MCLDYFYCFKAMLEDKNSQIKVNIYCRIRAVTNSLLYLKDGLCLTSVSVRKCCNVVIVDESDIFFYVSFRPEHDLCEIRNSGDWSRLNYSLITSIQSEELQFARWEPSRKLHFKKKKYKKPTFPSHNLIILITGTICVECSVLIIR